MNVLSWIIVGLISGWSAGMFIHRGSFGLVGDIIAGVVGGFLGGFIANTFPKIGNPTSGLSLDSILVAFVGAVTLLVILRLLSRAPKNIFR